MLVISGYFGRYFGLFPRPVFSLVSRVLLAAGARNAKKMPRGTARGTGGENRLMLNMSLFLHIPAKMSTGRGPGVELLRLEVLDVVEIIGQVGHALLDTLNDP